VFTCKKNEYMRPTGNVNSIEKKEEPPKYFIGGPSQRE
jgi:hypothetical protein